MRHRPMIIPKAVIGTGLAALVAAALFSASVALGATSKAQPSMEVKPSAKGLKYKQTVEIKGHHLPKGSGQVAATICGLQDDAGKSIKKPTADDCAGASEIGKLVQVKPWQSNGEFDTKYTLPASGQKFGNHKRFCNKTHHCALVVADANPDHPAYYIATPIEFVDQATKSSAKKSTAKPKAKPQPTTTTTTTQPPVVSMSSSGSGSANQNEMQFKMSVSASVTAPSGSLPLPAPPTPGSNPVPPEVASAIDQACTQLATAVKQAGGDPTALLTACDGITSGNGPQELQAVLAQPSLLCVEGASAWQNNAQITDACNQAAAGLAPATSAVGGALAPVFGNL